MSKNVTLSLGIVIKAPEGIVLAAESRVTLTTKNNAGEKIHVNFDNATKVLSFNNYENIGAVTYGQAAIGFRTVQSFIPEFESYLESKANGKLSVVDFAKELSAFFLKQWTTSMPADYNGPNMVIIVAGFDDNEAYGKVFIMEIPKKPNPIENNPTIDGKVQFGITWGGQREIVDRLLLGYDLRLFQILKDSNIAPEKINEIQSKLKTIGLQTPVQFMPIQDCINLALLFIRTTIETQELTVGLRGCGGPIDVAIITKENHLKFVQQKEIVGQLKK